LAPVIWACAQSGRAEKAEQIARGIEDPSWQAPALATAAWTMAVGGRIEDAERIAGEAEQKARGIEDPWLLARTLTDVAMALVDNHLGERSWFDDFGPSAGRTDLLVPRAERMVAQVLASAEWHMALPALAYLRPSSCVDVVERWTSRSSGA
jgi:hypothetical protein